MPETRSQIRKNQPGGSSTPLSAASAFGVSGRNSIHHSVMESPIAPNEANQRGEESNTDQEDESDNEDVTDSDESESQQQVTQTQERECSVAQEPPPNLLTPCRQLDDRNFLRFSLQKWFIWLVPFGVISAVAYPYLSDTQPRQHFTTLQDIQHNFPSQTKDFWLAFNSGITEVEKFSKPSVFLLLHEAKAQSTINKLVRQLSLYSACIIKDNCTLDPIVPPKSVLNSDDALRDHGLLITKYKPELESQGVMVVNNIDQIKGSVAQIFHSMCDEYTPLVDKTVFILTLQIDKFPLLRKEDMQLVENVLYNKWNDLKDDLFYPLFTRITNIVLRVLPEK